MSLNNEMSEVDIQNFKKSALRAHEAFDAYFEILQPLITEKFPDDTKTLMARLKRLRDDTAALADSGNNVTGDIVASIGKLCEISDEIGAIYASFDAPRMQSMNISNSNVSGTNRLDIVDAFENLAGKYNRINKDIMEILGGITATYVQKISADITAAADPAESLRQLHALVMQNLPAYDMYLGVIETLLTTNTLVPVIKQMLESDKNAILVPDCKEERRRGISFPCRRLGLLPHEDVAPCLPRELHAKIYGTAKEVSFAKWAKDRGITILVINSVAYDVVEYKTAQLFKKDASLTPAYGISSGIIERTNIITVPDDKTAAPKFDFSAEVYGEENGGNGGFVFETIDGVHYRVLRRREEKKGASLAPFDIADIVKYFKSPSMCTRVSTYQEICNAEACRRMMVRKQPNTSLFEVTASTIDANYIRNQVVLRLNGVLHTLLTRGSSTEKDIIKILHSHQLVDEFGAALLDFYKIGAIGIHDFSGGMFPFSEMLSTFLVEVENLRRQFIKELHDGYARTKPSADPSSSYETQRRLETLIIDVVQTVIPSDDNIYSSLNYKYMLLNYDR